MVGWMCSHTFKAAVTILHCLLTSHHLSPHMRISYFISLSFGFHTSSSSSSSFSLPPSTPSHLFFSEVIILFLRSPFPVFVSRVNFVYVCLRASSQ